MKTSVKTQTKLSATKAGLKPTATKDDLSGAVKFVDAALEERGEFIILRGVIDPESLDHLITPDYQRGVLTGRGLRELGKAIETSKVPDVELAVRGGQFTERGDGFYVQSPVYIMDGLQRISAARMMREKGFVPYLGATAHFNTELKWERERFKILNAERVKVSPNVLLRNLRTENEAIRTIFELTNRDRNFVMYDRVSWQQKLKRTEVMSALILMKTILFLHAHLAPRTGSSRWDDVADGINRLMKRIGKPLLVYNACAFFNVIDECWSIRDVVFTERQSHLKGPFLAAVATVVSGHLNFWNGERVFFDRQLVKKISTFPLHDPEVKNLLGANGQARIILMHLLTNHINSGKRTKRLKPRQAEMGDTAAENSAEAA
jgi:hypothetical protein